MHTGTMNRRELVDQASGRLDRAYVAKADAVRKRIRLEAELEEVKGREKGCDDDIETAERELNEAARAPEMATPPAAPAAAVVAVREFVGERQAFDEGGGGPVAAVNDMN